MKNIKTTFESFIFESENPSYGWRIGDLKHKPERLHNFRGGRGTGHFGTGFYFTGFKPNEETDKHKRGIFKIDFNDYNLLKVPSNNSGLELHKCLKETARLDLKTFNGLYNKLKLQYTLGIKIVHSWINHSYDSIEFINNKAEKWLKEKIEFIKKDIINNAQIKKDIYSFFEDSDDIQDYTDFDIEHTIDAFFIFHSRELIEKILLSYLKAYNENLDNDIKSISKEHFEESKTAQDIIYNKIYEIIDELKSMEVNKSEIFHKFAEDILTPLASVLSKIESINDNIEKRNEKDILNIFMSNILKISRRVPTIEAHHNKTTIGTELIKSLGYEGIDVRGLNALDNYTYGSVIYDIKS